MNPVIASRSLLSTPLLLEAARQEIDLKAFAEVLGTKESYLIDVLSGGRECTIERYFEIASHLGMDISLVPKHMARLAALETRDGMAPAKAATAGQVATFTRSLAKTLRNHRVRNEMTVEQVANSISAQSSAFSKFQNNIVAGTLPSLSTIQRYASLLNLSLVAVPSTSEYARHAKADGARPVTWRSFEPAARKTSTTVDKLLLDLLTKVRHTAPQKAAHISALNDMVSALSDLQPVAPAEKTLVRMPKAFAAVLQAKMEAARTRGERVPYADVVKPWGKPKSWSRFIAKDSFSKFYGAIDAFAVRADNLHEGMILSSMCARKEDRNLGDTLRILENAGLALTLKVPSVEQTGSTISITSAPELSFVVSKLLQDRSSASIAKATTLSKQSLESLTTHPEHNRLSTLFRLFEHYGIEPSVEKLEHVYEAHLAVANSRKDEAGLAFTH